MAEAPLDRRQIFNELLDNAIIKSLLMGSICSYLTYHFYSKVRECEKNMKEISEQGSLFSV
jgi:hypothetical protein